MWDRVRALIARLRDALARRPRTPASEIVYKTAAEVADAGWDQARKIPTKRGDKVRSWGEARIADWLHAHGVRYEYEPLILGRRPDFYLLDLGVIVEYGGVEKPDYVRRHKVRMKLYADAGIPVISLSGRRWREVDARLEAGLRRWGWRG